jgi:RNA polymerase sigma-70 factor (ECF subfamily)
MAAVAAAFRAGLVDTAAGAFVDDDATVATIERLYAAGAAAWPDLVLAIERFETEVARRLGAAATPTALSGLHHDVYLVVAAHGGDPRAVAACDQLCNREVDFAAARLRATSTQADDMRSELRRLLFTSDGERPAAMASFSGRGDLRGYARVIVARALARRMQRDRREQAFEDDMLDVLTPSLDPEVAVLRERYRPDVDAAFRAALAALSERGRAVLRYNLIDGWSIDQLGERYGVHRATAARWLAAAREELGARIRSDLAQRLAITESQVDSIVALVTSRIEVSLERLLT